MANRHMERCSALLISRERPFDTAMRYHLIPIRRVIIKQLMNNRCCRACGEEGNPLTLLGECKLLQPLCKTVRKFLKKLKQSFRMIQQFQSRAYIWNKTIPWKDSCTPVFRAAKLTVANTWEQPKYPSTGEWINKMYMLKHTENGIPLRDLKNEIMTFAAAWMDLELSY